MCKFLFFLCVIIPAGPSTYPQWPTYFWLCTPEQIRMSGCLNKHVTHANLRVTFLMCERTLNSLQAAVSMRLIACVKRALSGHLLLKPHNGIQPARVSMLWDCSQQFHLITMLRFNHVVCLMEIVIQRSQMHLPIKEQLMCDCICKTNNISYASLHIWFGKIWANASQSVLV